MNCKHIYDSWTEAVEHIERRGKAVAKEAADYYAEYRHIQGSISTKNKTAQLKDLARRKLQPLKDNFSAYKGLIDKYRPDAYKAVRECKSGLSGAQYKALRESLDRVDAQLREVRKAYDPAVKLSG